ncbi:MAG: hypothetical protein IRZ16_17425 [Myxococcaceae bacterium]|nr:hypothetical protein [Myxococcaceae bacterium]
MAFEAVGRTLVIVHNANYPTDAEWDAYLQALLAHVTQWKDRRSLVLTAGGAPSSKQRTRMSEVVGDSVAPTAVLTTSAPVQATVGALHLRNAAIRTFPPDDLDGALAHLGLREEEKKRILLILPGLKQKVGVEPEPT